MIKAIPLVEFDFRDMPAICACYQYAHDRRDERYRRLTSDDDDTVRATAGDFGVSDIAARDYSAARHAAAENAASVSINSS